MINAAVMIDGWLFCTFDNLTPGSSKICRGQIPCSLIGRFRNASVSGQRLDGKFSNSSHEVPLEINHNPECQLSCTKPVQFFCNNPAVLYVTKHETDEWSKFSNISLYALQKGVNKRLANLQVLNEGNLGMVTVEPDWNSEDDTFPLFLTWNRNEGPLQSNVYLNAQVAQALWPTESFVVFGAVPSRGANVPEALPPKSPLLVSKEVAIGGQVKISVSRNVALSEAFTIISIKVTVMVSPNESKVWILTTQNESFNWTVSDTVPKGPLNFVLSAEVSKLNETRIREFTSTVTLEITGQAAK